MAIEAGGIPSLAENPTNIGAVYLSDTVNPLDVHLGNLKKFDEGQRARQAEKLALKQQAMKMTADLKYNPDGILPEDTAPISGMAQKVFEDYAAIQAKYAGDVGNPNYVADIAKWNVDKQRLDTAISGSKSFNQYLQKAADGDLSKLDKSHVTNMAQLRMLPLEQRMGEKGDEAISKYPLYQPKRISLYDTVKKKLDKIPREQKVMRDEAGNIVTEQLLFGSKGYYTEEKLSDQQLNTLNSALQADYDVVQDATDEFNLLPQGSANRISITEEANRRGVDPSTVMIERMTNAINAPKISFEEGKESTAHKEGVKYGYKKKEEEEKASFVLEQMGNIFTGKAKVYNGQSATPTEWNTLSKVGGGALASSITAAQAWYSNNLAGISAGNFNVQRTDANGNVSLDTEPNNIIGWKYKPDGTVLVKTAQSAYIKDGGGSRMNGMDIDDEGYVPVTENIITGIAVENKIPTSSVRSVLSKANGYNGNVANVRVLAKTNEPSVTQPAQQQQQNAPKTTTRTKIKSLVGTKGYEGYTEQELIDYYKSQGYNIQ